MPPYRFQVDDAVMCRTGPEDWSPGIVVGLDYKERNMPKPAPYQVELIDGRLIFVPEDTEYLCKAMHTAWWEGLFHNGSINLEGEALLHELEAELAAGKNPNERSALDDTLLLAALRSKWLAGAGAALKAGADQNMGSASFVRPLSVAVRNGPAAVELLLNAKADPNLQEKDPNQCHDRKSVTFERREWHRVPLHYAAQKCIRSCTLLLDAKADARVMDGQYKQPLHLALESNKLDIAELLLSHGADVDAGNAVTGLTFTPLLDAAYRGDANAVELLLRHRADVNRPGKLGNTALHLVCRGQRSQLAMKLLAVGADPMLRNSSGKTAADIAAANGALELATKLGGAH